MAYYHVKDFVRGLDVRRMVEATEAGALIRATNCVITPGGEVEKRKAFNKIADLPDNTFGFYSIDNLLGSFHVWGSEPAPTMPSRFTYHRLEHPGAHAMTRVRCVRYFMRKFYVVAEFANGDILNFYDGELVVSDPYPPAPPPEGNSNNTTNPNPVGGNRATARIKFTRKEVAEGETNPAINLTRIYATTFTGVSEPSTDYETHDAYVGTLAIPATDTAEAVAQKVADAINAYSSAGSEDFNAQAENDLVYVSFDESGTQWNGYSIGVVFDTDGVFEVNPKPAITFGGVDSTNDGLPGSADQPPFIPGTYAIQHRDKMFAVTGASGLLRSSQLRAPNAWSPNYPGAQFWDFSEANSSAANLNSLAVFQDKLAIFAGKAIYVWFMDELGDGSQEVSVVHNTGTWAPRSVVEYGNTDVFYLDATGIRSLKSRDISGAAFASDVGSPIDDLVRESYIGALWYASQASGVIDPIDGRYILAMVKGQGGTVFYVFSFFTETKIAAWTRWETDWTIEELVVSSSHMFARTRNEVYVYGLMEGFGATEEYDSAPVEVQLPYLHMGTPATEKEFIGVDVAIENQWNLELGMDYTDPDLLETIGLIGETTYREQRVAVQGYGSHASVRLTCAQPGYARLGSMALHYMKGEEAG